MIAVERAEVSTIAPLAALVLRREKRRMIQPGDGRRRATSRVRLQSMLSMTHSEASTISRFCV